MFEIKIKFNASSFFLFPKYSSFRVSSLFLFLLALLFFFFFLLVPADPASGFRVIYLRGRKAHGGNSRFCKNDVSITDCHARPRFIFFFFFKKEKELFQLVKDFFLYFIMFLYLGRICFFEKQNSISQVGKSGKIGRNR